MHYSNCGKEQTWIFDCGDGSEWRFSSHCIGSLRQMINIHMKRTKVNKIFITHLHVDHSSGLVSLLSDLDMCRSCIVSFMLGHYMDKTRFELDIYGPYHLSELILPFLHYSKMGKNININIFEFLQEGEVLRGTTKVVPKT